MNAPHIRTALVVDDDPAAASALHGELTLLGFERRLGASTLCEGIALLEREPDLVVVEACLPDGNATELVKRARRATQTPVIVVTSGHADRRVVAELMWQGADAYVEKPVYARDLTAVIERLCDGTAVCQRMARLLVGRIGLKEAQQQLRGTMNLEALARTGGSRRAAAHLLGVDRRYVQRLLENFEAR